MFIKVDSQYLNEYKKNDYLLPIILEEKKHIHPKVAESRQFQNMIVHQWKRAMFHTLYGDLVERKILDIGGAYCGYSNLIKLNNYTLLERDKTFKNLQVNIIRENFQGHIPKTTYDFVICCDIFLTDSGDFIQFLDKYLAICKELRFSLTYRFDTKEDYRAWTLKSVNEILHRYGHMQERNTDIKEIDYEKVSYLPNRRNVYLISLKGDIQ